MGREVFVSYKYSDAVDTREEIRKKLIENKVHLISTKSCLRIALCSMNKSEAKRLPKIIKDSLSKLGF